MFAFLLLSSSITAMSAVTGVGIALLVALALVSVALVILWREGQAVRVDRDRLCAALERIGDGDYSPQTLDLQSTILDDVGAAYQRMVPTISSTIEGLEWHAQHDALTSTLNANSFKRRCTASLSHDRESSLVGGAMLFFDINDFKKINDSLGHDAGDRFLVTCADRIRLACSTFKSTKLAALAAGIPLDSYGPIIGRLGGDEFGVFLPGNPGIDEVERFVFRLQRLISEPCQIGSHSLTAKISVGIAFSTEHHNAYDKLLAAADTAMYEAKHAESGGYRFYDEAMRNQADQILHRELEIRQAIQQSQFRLYFQPQVNLATNRIESAEALIRWEHPTRGIVGPMEFIPFAETYNLIDDVGDWVLAEALSTAARWRKQGREIRLSINISPKQLNRVEFIPLVRALLDFHKLPPQALEIEITEAAIMRSDEIPLERIEGLRRDGVAIALDDFGTGYSNLAQLLGLPMDRLKLDRSLLQASIQHRRSRMVVLALVQLARKLGFEVVAEGVETEDQLRLLQQSRCHLVQGFLFAPPLPETEFLELCDKHAEARDRSAAA